MYLKLFILIFLAFTLIGCGGENNVESGNRLGILHFGNGAEPQGLDPHVVTGVPEHHIITALLEGLVLKNPATLEIIPGVAERWEISADGRVYTFHLRHNALWSNGDPITAEDFRWTWWRGMQPQLGNKYAYMFYPIHNARAYQQGRLKDFGEVGIDVPDTHTLRVTLTNPTPYFLQLLDHYSYFPLHRATIERFGAADERGTRWTRAGNFVGNGPFQLSEWKLHKRIVVAKNPRYWDADAVALNGIHFYPTENQSTEERMFRAGQLHRTENVPVDKIAHYGLHHPELIRVQPYLGTYYYRFNTRQKPFDDSNVRKALALAIDREQIVQQVTRAGELSSYTFTPPDTLGYTASSPLAYDPARGRELLAAAGYPAGKGFPVVNLLYNTNENHRKVAVAIQQMWKTNLNINVLLDNQDWKVFIDSVNQRNYGISRAGWIGDYVDPNTFLEMWVSDGGNNMTGWANARYDEIILEQAPREPDRAARYALFSEAESILLDELPVLPIYTYTSKHLLRPAVRGMPANILDYILWKEVALRPVPEAHD